MEYVLEKLTKEMEAAFEKAGFQGSYGKVSLSNRPDLCEYQCNGAMAAAKEYHKAPFQIAESVAQNLSENSFFQDVSVVKPGFINLNVTGEFLCEYLKGMSAEEHFGFKKKGAPKKVVIDYGGPNVAKPLHVGHLRSAIIGESIKRMMRFAGDDVKGDVHLGDWGLQIGLIIMELQRRKPDLPYFDPEITDGYPEEPPFTMDDLSDIYPTASAYSKENEEFLLQAREATAQFQEGRPGYVAIWKHIIGVSIPDLRNNYERLNVSFDWWKKESDAKPYVEGMVKKMQDGGFTYESEGALVVDVTEETDKKEIPPCIIIKSNGATMYSTTDLATIVERVESFDPNEIIYIVDKRQSMHFTQVFRTAKKTGLCREDVDLTFIGFGTMNGKDGKPFKTRDGGVLRLQTLVDEIQEKIYEKIQETREYEEDEMREISRKVGVAALKYADLSNQASKDYIFDLERFTSFEGNTGPYILYTVVRIKSILEKAKAEGLEGKTLLAPANASEKKLYMALTKFPEMMESAYEDQAPHKICQYMYELCEQLNHFYHENSILKQEDEERKASYLVLLPLVKDVLVTCLDLLGMEAPDRM